MLSKEGAIVLPGLLFVWDAARGDLDRGLLDYMRRRGATYVGVAAAAAAVLGVRWAVLGHGVAGEPAAAFVPDASFATRFFTMIRVWPHYVRLLVAPFDLSANYSPAVILPAREMTSQGALGLALAAGVALLGWREWRRDPHLTGGLAWIALALLPVSNLLFASGVVLAERTLYLPSAGLSLIAASLTERVGRTARALGGPRVRGAARRLRGDHRRPESGLEGHRHGLQQPPPRPPRVVRGALGARVRLGAARAAG